MIGKTITEFRGRSFYIERRLVCNCLVIFIGMRENIWFSVTVSEGLVQITKQDEPAIEGLDDILDEYAYPIFVLKDFERYFGKTISALYNYKMNEKIDISIGLYVECEDIGFTIWDENDCLRLIHGKRDAKLHNVRLERML